MQRRMYYDQNIRFKISFHFHTHYTQWNIDCSYFLVVNSTQVHRCLIFRYRLSESRNARFFGHLQTLHGSRRQCASPVGDKRDSYFAIFLLLYTIFLDSQSISTAFSVSFGHLLFSPLYIRILCTMLSYILILIDLTITMNSVVVCIVFLACPPHFACNILFRFSYW